MKMQKPKPLSGFPELLPQEQIVYQGALDVIRKEYEKCGFAQIETPAVERRDTLLSKGGNEKEIYALSRLAAQPEESSQTEIALHFDLTVPLARYVTMYESELAFPFRRYQIQKVWRGERAQSGRYREFHQCDIDVVGRGELALITDAEIPSIIYNIFQKLDIGPFVIRISNRKILEGYFEHLNIAQGDVIKLIRIIDQLEKKGREFVIAELETGVSLGRDDAQKLIAFLERDGSNDELLTFLRSQKMGETFSQGCEELEKVVKGMRAFGVPEEFFRIDLTIARGLDYYTGTIYETLLSEHPEIGSVCSGGRYDNLASHFSDEKFPGVGISIGVTRLLVPLLQSGAMTTGGATPAKVLVTMMDPSYEEKYIALATHLRAAGIATEVYLARKKFRDQMTYANKKGFPLVVIAGEDEVKSGRVQIKDMRSGDAIEKSEEELTAAIKEMLG